MIKALFTYKIMRIRQKISLKCIKQSLTLTELLLNQVLRTYKSLNPLKELYFNQMYDLYKENKFDSFENML